MSWRTNNKNGNRKPKEDTVCQTTILGEIPTQSVSKLNTGKTSRENPYFTNTTSCNPPTEWYERNWVSKVRDIGLELLIIILLNCIADYLGLKEHFIQMLVALGCVIAAFIVLYSILKTRKYKETICAVTADTAKKVDGLCDVVNNYKAQTHEYINRSANGHIKLVSSTKRLTISKRKRPKKGESRFICKLEHIMEIYNYGDSTFANYIYDISSSLGVSQEEGYIIRIGTDINHGLSSFKKSRYEITYDNGESRRGMKISLPVQIESHEAKTISISEPDTPSFDGISECCENKPVDDWLSISIYYPTDLLSFELILDPSMKEYQFLKKDGYTIPNSGSLHPDSYTTSVCCLILDRSEQVVASERAALKRKELNPPVLDIDNDRSGFNRLSWNIPDPKIGYRYQLFFTLAKNQVLKKK